MIKYYDEKEIWRKIREELNELDIDDTLYYTFVEDGLNFSDYYTGVDDSDFERIEDIFQNKEFEKIDIRDIEIINRLSNMLITSRLYRDMMVARGNYAEYVYKTFEKNDDKLTKLSIKFEISVKIYLWFKYIFSEVVKTLRQILNDCASTINEIYEII